MEILRTPDARFEGLEGFAFAPHYAEVPAAPGSDQTLRIHYLDEGPADGEVLLCMHGQPSWCYLYRKMIPVLVAAGYRVIAPDLVGFGRSDKPGSRSDYSYAAHVGWITALVEILDLSAITLVCQDWGGLIGLRVLTARPERFARAVTSNTGLPDARGIPDEMAGPMRELFASIPALPPQEMGAKLRENEHGAGFMYWIKYCAEFQDFTISDVMNLSASGDLTDAQKGAYDAPFPDESFKQGARQFPSLVPIFPDDPSIAANREAWQVLEAFDKPFLTAFTDSDPVTAGAHVRFQESVPGAQGQTHVTLHGAGHFVQEDAGEVFAGIIVGFCAANPLPVV